MASSKEETATMTDTEFIFWKNAQDILTKKKPREVTCKERPDRKEIYGNATL